MRSHRLMAAAGLAVTVGFAMDAQAASRYWKGTISNDVTVGGNPGNWASSAGGANTASAPGSGDEAFLQYVSGANNSPNVPASGFNPKSIRLTASIDQTNFPGGYTLSGDPGATLALGSSTSNGRIDTESSPTNFTVSVPNLELRGGGNPASLTAGYLSAGATAGPGVTGHLYITSSSFKAGTGTLSQSSGPAVVFDASWLDVGNIYVTPAVDFSSNTIDRRLLFSPIDTGRIIQLDGGIIGMPGDLTDVEVAAGSAGKAIINGTSSNIGATTVNAGTLLINGTYGSSGAVTVATGATLGGNGGTIASAVTISTGGTLAPGASIGTLGVASADIDGNWAIEINSASNLSDLLNVAGSLDLTDATLTFSELGSEGPVPVGNLVIASYGSGGLTQPSLAQASVASANALALGYSIDYNYQGNNQIALVPVPEPTTLGLAAVGLAGLALRRRRAR